MLALARTLHSQEHIWCSHLLFSRLLLLFLIIIPNSHSWWNSYAKFNKTVSFQFQKDCCCNAEIAINAENSLLRMVMLVESHSMTRCEYPGQIPGKKSHISQEKKHQEILVIIFACQIIYCCFKDFKILNVKVN